MCLFKHKFINQNGVIFCEHCWKQEEIQCNHKWEIIAENSVYQPWKEKPMWNKYTLQCKECWEIKYFNNY